MRVCGLDLLQIRHYDIKYTTSDVILYGTRGISSFVWNIILYVEFNYTGDEYRQGSLIVAG